MSDVTVKDKSYTFAIRIVKLCRYLQEGQKEYIITKQLLRCGTSIGANLAEAKYAQSRADFISKTSIALKEASETNYWLNLLYDSKYLNQIEFDSIKSDLEEILKMLTSIINTSKKNGV